jgi:hypothetical protein
MTLGMIRAITETGLRCPADVAVVGFDDVPWTVGFHPQLTVAAQPAYDMGVVAADILFERLSKKLVGPPVRKVLNAKLIVRESSGAALRNRAFYGSCFWANLSRKSQLTDRRSTARAAMASPVVHRRIDRNVGSVAVSPVGSRCTMTDALTRSINQ